MGVQIAYKNQMDFSMAISLGSSIQVAFFVTPILILLGHPLDLIFTPLELGALAAAVTVTAFISGDGESNWLEGAMPVSVYIIAA